MTSKKLSNNNGPTGDPKETHRLNIQTPEDKELPGEQTLLTDKTFNDSLVEKNNQLNRSNGDVSESIDNEDEYSETECGWGPCSPNWIKVFASKQVFLAVFCVAWVLQGMYHTYFVSAITTIEKLFQIQSKITGIIMSATEMGQIGSSLLLTYYGGQGHRPKWIAWGMVLFAVSSFTCSLPHFIYGKHLINANDLTGIIKEPNVCRSPNSSVNIFSQMFLNSSPSLLVDHMSSNVLQTCEDDLVPGHQIHPSVTNIVLAIFFVSLLGVGMGQTAVYTLGIPYIDDNVASKESPLYFAITIGVRILGPAFGFIVGSLCTSVYADLSIDPKIDSSDPRWVGAWWLGLVLISGLLILASIAMFAFPKRLPHAKHQHRNRRIQLSEKKHPSIRDFPKTVKRLLNNDILMFRTASSVLHILPIAGLYTFLPKYLESQFRLPTPTANMISGVGGILVMGLGIVISGVFILRFKPNARFVAGWIAFTAIIYSMGMGILMFIGCPMSDLAEFSPHQGLEQIQVHSCNESFCNCNKDKFQPICGEDERTYLSPCYAGCQGYTKKDGKIIEYSECLCVNTNKTTLDNNFTLGTATIGYCDLECPNFMLYIILFSIFVFIHSTSEVGSMLLILRCVDPVDKAMALGLIQFAIGLFGNVPCPIIYGAVVDSACLIWKMTCGERGACGLYDSDAFRMFYHGTTGALLLCAFFVDLIVWYKAGSINFVDEQAPFEEELAEISIKIKSEPE